MKVIIIGGGIVGLSSAYYLQRSGWEVTVLDKGDFRDNCSYGNAGYVCPSHFIPLASPGIVKQGLRLMWNPRSPFYVQPRLNASLISWGLKFISSATQRNLDTAAAPLRDIALLSQREYQQWSQDFDFAYEHKGLLEIFQTDEKAAHAAHTVHQAHELGLTDTELLTAEQLQALEPHTKIIGKGAILFRCDAHLYPNKLMQGLLGLLKKSGVSLIPHAVVTSIEKQGGIIRRVLASGMAYEADQVVLAAGAWSREVAAFAGLRIPLVGGRGYSVTLENSPYRINYPSVLMEGRVALTPMDGNKIRFGGTMEITSLNRPPRLARVQGILDAVKRYYPEFDVALPPVEKVWYGYRPCSADGLPYIGRSGAVKNLVVATGHSMLGLSLGAGTGKLVSELLNEQPTSMDLRPFSVERFG